MMIVTFLAIALLQKLHTTGSTPGSELYGQCQANLQVMNSPESVFDKNKPNLVLDGYRCQSFMEGYVAGAALKVPKAFCVEDKSLVTVIQAYVTYMSQHENLMEERRAVGVYEALHHVFPCRAA